MSEPPPDVVDHLVGIVPGSRLDEIRRMRIQARDNAQASYSALFEPADSGAVTLAERAALAAFVAGLHGPSRTAEFYMTRLDGAQAASVRAETAAGATHGPYGSFPAGPLTKEDLPGPAFRVSDAGRAALGGKLAAAFEHAHMLVFHPRDSDAHRLQALLDASWSTTAIVTLSQLVAFLAFQVRMVAGLSALATAMRHTEQYAMRSSAAAAAGS